VQYRQFQFQFQSQWLFLVATIMDLWKSLKAEKVRNY
jgi:hypothetical protein